MKIEIDREKAFLIKKTKNSKEKIPLYSKEAFECISSLWLEVGWCNKYSYQFTWLGRPIIQLPEDLLRIQEVIYQTKPDVIIETGIAHGGSLIFYASLCKLIGKGRVIGIDVEIRAENRKKIEKHELFDYITLLEGSSTAPEIIKQIKELIKPGERIFVVLDSCHSKEHVFNELNVYKDFVTQNSYMVATDGILRDLGNVPQGKEYINEGDPTQAVEAFLKENKGFILETPNVLFNESPLTKQITYWPNAWLKKISNG